MEIKYILFWGILFISSMNILSLFINLGMTIFIFYITKNIYNTYSQEEEDIKDKEYIGFYEASRTEE